MAKFCIPPEIAKKIRTAARDRVFTIDQLYQSNTVERRALFEKLSGSKKLAEEINTEFEKAMVSTQENAIMSWVNSTFTKGQKNSTGYETIVKKLAEIENKKVLLGDGTPVSNAVLDDFIADKLGITLSEEEYVEIQKRAEKLTELFQGIDAIGDPTQSTEKQIEYLKELQNMHDYLQSLAPSSNLKVTTSIIGRGNLLFRVSSPIINIISNTGFGGIQALKRRIAGGMLGGVNNDLAKKYVAHVVKTFNESSVDMTRMMSLDDRTKVRGENVTSAQGKGKIRKVGRFYEDLVFKKLMSTPDVVSAAIAFADRANIESTLIAKKQGLKGENMKIFAENIMLDAMRVAPTTEDGRIVREMAIADAQYSTFTNESTWADVALGVREVLNKASGDIRLGDQIIPFAKTPANIVAASIDYGGYRFIPQALYRGILATKDVVTGNRPFNQAFREQFRGLADTAIKAGLGMTLAFILASLFDPEDFLGAYDAKEKELNYISNRVTNAVKIGDKWISLDFLGPIATPFVGMMYAKKYGKGVMSTAYNFYRGGLSALTSIPGLDEIKDQVEQLQQVAAGEQQSADLVEKKKQDSIEFVRSRLTPGVVSDIAKMTDDHVRETKGQGTFAQFKNNLPVARQSLPIKEDIYGDALKTESWWSQLFFGSRLKTARESALIDEANRLADKGYVPNLAPQQNTSSRFPKFREQVTDEKYQDAIEYMQDKTKKDTEFLIQKLKYKNASDEEKKKLIDDVRNDVLEATLDKFHYKEPKKGK